MEKVVKQYEQIVSRAWEISQVLLDIEGGRYVLAMFSELIQELLGEGNIAGAVAVMRKLHEAAEVPFEPCTLDEGEGEDEGAAWTSLFLDALGDIPETIAY